MVCTLNIRLIFEYLSSFSDCMLFHILWLVLKALCQDRESHIKLRKEKEGKKVSLSDEGKYIPYAPYR